MNVSKGAAVNKGNNAMQSLLQDSFFNPGKNLKLGTPCGEMDEPSYVSNELLPKLKDDPIYSKYFKLLAMRVPVPAVKAKMMQEGLGIY